MQSDWFGETWVAAAHDRAFGPEFETSRDILATGAGYLQSVYVAHSRARSDLTTIALLRTFVVYGKAALEDLRSGLLEPAAAHMRTILEARLIQLYFCEHPDEMAQRVDRYLAVVSASEKRDCEDVLASATATPERMADARGEAQFWKKFLSSPSFAEANAWLSQHNGAWHPYGSTAGLARHFSGLLAYEQRFSEFSSYGSHVAHPVHHLLSNGGTKIRAPVHAETSGLVNAVSMLVPLLFHGIMDAMEHFDPSDQRLKLLKPLQARVEACLLRAIERKKGAAETEGG